MPQPKLTPRARPILAFLGAADYELVKAFRRQRRAWEIHFVGGHGEIQLVFDQAGGEVLSLRNCLPEEPPEAPQPFAPGKEKKPRALFSGFAFLIAPRAWWPLITPCRRIRDRFRPAAAGRGSFADPQRRARGGGRRPPARLALQNNRPFQIFGRQAGSACRPNR